jgi:hypothetical protein
MFAKPGVTDRADVAHGVGYRQERGIGWHYIVADITRKTFDRQLSFTLEATIA